MDNWGFSRPTDSLEKCGFASISSPDNEDPESPKFVPNGSSAVCHGPSTMDDSERDCGRETMEGREEGETWRLDAVDTALRRLERQREQNWSKLILDSPPRLLSVL